MSGYLQSLQQLGLADGSVPKPVAQTISDAAEATANAGGSLGRSPYRRGALGHTIRGRGDAGDLGQGVESLERGGPGKLRR